MKLLYPTREAKAAAAVPRVFTNSSITAFFTPANSGIGPTSLPSRWKRSSHLCRLS